MCVEKIMALGLVLGAAIIMAKIGSPQSTLFLIGIVLLLFFKSNENEVR